MDWFYMKLYICFTLIAIQFFETKFFPSNMFKLCEYYMNQKILILVNNESSMATMSHSFSLRSSFWKIE